jgi:DNA-binding transcriptional LysR family regulator
MIEAKVISLLTVAETKNITKAAELLSLTQPAVSHHINQLEKELGVKIFIRGKGNLQLTDAGKTVVKYAKLMCSAYDRMIGKLADAEKHLTRLRIGITHTAESSVIVEVLAKYSNENPDIMITIITDTIKNLYTMLESYELDLVIAEGRPLKPSLNTLLLDTDYLVCAVSNENPLSKKPMVTISALKKEKMIMRLPKSGTVNLFASSLESINESIDEFNIILEVENIATIKTLIRKNLGVSVIPKSTCLAEARKGKLSLLPIENMSMLRETNIIYQKDFGHLEILQEIMEIYRKTAKKNVSV